MPLSVDKRIECGFKLIGSARLGEGVWGFDSVKCFLNEEDNKEAAESVCSHSSYLHIVLRYPRAHSECKRDMMLLKDSHMTNKKVIGII